MALINHSDPRICASKRHFKPLMLRDYLLDDLGSCSSNGFKSFARRQCGADTVRFLLDRSKTSSSNDKQRLTRSRSTCMAAFGFAVQRTSTALVNAVKLLPFPSSIKSQSQSVRNRGQKKEFLPRSFSKKILKRSFWRKADRHLRERYDQLGLGRQREANPNREQGDGDKIERQGEANDRDCYLEYEKRRWRSFAELLQEPLDEITITAATTFTTTTITSYIAAAETKSAAVPGSGRDSISDSFDGGEFCTNSDVLHSSVTSGDSEDSSDNDAVEDETSTLDETVGANASEPNCTENRKEWSSDEKEQFSPVSVLDCLFEHEDNDMEGSENRVRSKTRRFGSFARLQPVDLDKRIESLSKNNLNRNQSAAGHLRSKIKQRIIEPNNLIASNAADNLLLDFFDEEMNTGNDAESLLNIAEEWINGRPRELFLGWEARGNRGIYVREMERKERWGNLDEDRENLVEELENGFFTDLVEGLMLDLFY